MKTLYSVNTLLLSTLFSLTVIAQNEYGDGSLREIGFRYNVWNTTTSAWEPGDSSRTSYDAQGNRTLVVGESSYPTVWTQSYIFLDVYAGGQHTLSVDSYFAVINYGYRSRETYVYNSDNRLQIRTQSRWNTPLAAWAFNNRTQYSYTGTGKTNIALNQVFQNSSWANSTRTTYSYNGNDWASSYLTENWDSATSAWLSNTRADYTYDGSGNRTLEVYQNWNGTNGVWDNTYKFEYTYDSEGRKLSEKSYVWSGGAWTNLSLETRTYSAQGVLQLYLNQSWSNTISGWVNNYRYLNTLGTNGFPEHRAYEQWDDIGSVWENYYQYDYTYNNNGYLTFAHIERWNEGVMGWDNSEDDYYWYGANPFAGINDKPANNLSLLVFPNPTTDVVTVHCASTQSQPMQAVLLDAGGREVAQLGTQVADGYQNYTFNLSSVTTKGLYYLSVKTGNSIGSMPLFIK